MSRPPHIAPLDEALERHLAELTEAEARHAKVLKRHADCLREIERAQQARMDAYYAARSVEQAIRRLDFVVLQGPGRAGVVPKDGSRLDGHSGQFNKSPYETDEEGRR